MSDREGQLISLPIEGRPAELKVIHVHERTGPVLSPFGLATMEPAGLRSSRGRLRHCCLIRQGNACTGAGGDRAQSDCALLEAVLLGDDRGLDCHSGAGHLDLVLDFAGVGLDGGLACKLFDLR